MDSGKGDTWDKLDPVQLQKQAELKGKGSPNTYIQSEPLRSRLQLLRCIYADFCPPAEAKRIRSLEARAKRAELRKEKRAIKSEAKKARRLKGNVNTKWTEDRKADEKLRKAITKPHKEERRYRKMLDRAERLEAQAKKLMKEAQMARARYAAMTVQREVGNRERCNTMEPH